MPLGFPLLSGVPLSLQGLQSRGCQVEVSAHTSFQGYVVFGCCVLYCNSVCSPIQHCLTSSFPPLLAFLNGLALTAFLCPALTHSCLLISLTLGSALNHSSYMANHVLCECSDCVWFTDASPALGILLGT